MDIAEVKRAETTLRDKRRGIKGIEKWGEKAYTTAIEALEKQIPLEAVIGLSNYGNRELQCPECACSIEEYGFSENPEESDVLFCPECGQRLKIGNSK